MQQLKIDTKYGPEVQPVIRAFEAEIRLKGGKVKTGTVVLIGSEHSDHGLWLLVGSTADLIGTLHEDDYKKMRRTRNVLLECTAVAFDDIERGYADATVTGRIGTVNCDVAYSYIQ